jgi:long-chain acyl-CoA synthetase
MLTHSAVVAEVSGLHAFLKQINESVDESDVILSYLPLAHIFDRSRRPAILSLSLQIFQLSMNFPGLK